MKRLFLLASLGLATVTSMPVLAGNLSSGNTTKDDTVLVKLANGAKMNLIVKNTEQLKSFQNYSLDSLIRTLNIYITEGDKKQSQMNGKDYTVTFKPAEETKNKKAPEKISITFKGTNKDSGKKEENKVSITVNYNEDGEKNGVSIGSEPTASSDTTNAKVKKNKRYTSGMNIDLGFNTLLNTKNNMLDVVGLKTWGSRFISFNPYYMARIGGAKSPFHLRTGLEFAFNNYMFDKSYALINNDNNGNPYSDLVKDSRNLEKSKLATTNLNLPLMAILDFKNSKNKSVFRIGAGGFAGYRIGGHTKIKYNLEGETKKDKGHSNFNLEDFQYGAKVTVGIYGLDLFANYSLNELFKDGRGPKANTLSFGISL